MLPLIASLHRAAWQGDVERVMREVKRGADVNGYDERGETPLISALKGWYYGPSVRLGPFILKVQAPVKVNGWELVVRYLLSHGADPNLREGYGDSLCPLHWAVRIGERAVKLLLRYGADPECRASGGISPLHYAAFYGSVDVIKSLLKAGADVNGRDDEGRTLLHYAAYNCSMNVIRYLEGVPSVDWGAVSKAEHTVAMYATHRCKAEDVLTLAVDRGKNVLHRDRKGLNLFHWMILNAEREDEIVSLIIFAYGEIPGLLEAKVPPCGISGLHLAAIANRPRTYLYLLRIGLKDYPVDVHKCFKSAPEGRFYAHQLLKLNSKKFVPEKERPAIF